MYTFVEVTMQTLKTTVKEHIIAAATQEFKTKGYEAASLRLIAQEANISVGNVYRYFVNKEHLFESVVMSILERFKIMLDVELSSFDNPHDAFRTLAQVLSQTIYELIAENKDALMVALMHRSTSQTILVQLKVFLTRLASTWSSSSTLINKQQSLDHVIDMLAHGLFQGCVRAVELSLSYEPDRIYDAIQLYFELHTYMIYAIEGVNE